MLFEEFMLYISYFYTLSLVIICFVFFDICILHPKPSKKKQNEKQKLEIILRDE